MGYDHMIQYEMYYAFYACILDQSFAKGMLMKTRHLRLERFDMAEC